MTFLAHLHGPVFLAVLCLVVFVEECGVPMPFAPGDLLLTLCGLTIRTGRMNPVLAVAAVYVATVAGAVAGREVFALAGMRLLRLLNGSPRLRPPLERATRILRRGGWPAVLLARLTPGLRIHTTEVAGLVGLPRRTFLMGLLPAAGVYVGVFVGAGALFGHRAVTLLLQIADRFGLGVVVVGTVLLWLGGLWLGARVLGLRSASGSGRA